MFSQLGCAKGKLYFADLLRLMQNEGQLTRGAGIDSRSASRKAPSLSGMGKSLTMSDLVLQTEAKAAEAAKKDLAPPRPSWLAKGRSVQNLNRFVKGAADLAQDRRSTEEGGGMGEKSNGSEAERVAAVWARRSGKSKDGGAMAVAMARAPSAAPAETPRI